MNECSECKGTGVLRINDEHGDEDDECPDCEGTGKLDSQGFSSSYSTETSENSGFVIQLEALVWISEIEGDPGRTVVRKNAQVFRSEKDAEAALVKAREYRPFRCAIIESRENTT